MNRQWSNEKRLIGERLKEELLEVSFDEQMKSSVISKSRKKRSFWEREILIPLPAAAFACALLIAIPSVLWWQLTSDEPRKAAIAREERIDPLVSLPAGTFYQSQLDREGREENP